MKNATNTKRTDKPADSGLVCKTISLPKDLADQAENAFANDPEMDFSKYIRALVRRDLQTAPAASLPKAA